MSKPSYDSLYCQLRRANKLDELMRFLEDPSSPRPGTYNRCVEAGAMVAGWGFAHSPPSIWRLYRRHVCAWRWEVAPSGVKFTEFPANREEEMRKMGAWRTLEFLDHPDLNPHVLVQVTRSELKKEVRRLKKEKFEVRLGKMRDAGLKSVAEEIRNSPEGRGAFAALRKMVGT